MGMKVTDAPDAAGVPCPKKSGEMDESESCKKCPYWSRCYATIMGAMRDVG